MKAIVFLFPAALFTIVALFGLAAVLGGADDVNTLLGLFVFAALALVFWGRWFRARRKNAPSPDSSREMRKHLSKKERRRERRNEA